MRFIGDVHGKIKSLDSLLGYYGRNGGGLMFQLGDMGLGFGGVHLSDYDPQLLKFIRGTHDDPALCRAHLNYAGDFGADGPFFWCGGAFSIDAAWRQSIMAAGSPAIWWPDEELSQDMLDEAYTLYAATKPAIVASHEAPKSVGERLLEVTGRRPEKWGSTESRTAIALERMFKAHQPAMWFFGHYHIPFHQMIGGTAFECLPELTVSAPVPDTLLGRP